jgi:hypothetical protein
MIFAAILTMEMKSELLQTQSMEPQAVSPSTANHSVSSVADCGATAPYQRVAGGQRACAQLATSICSDEIVQPLKPSSTCRITTKSIVLSRFWLHRHGMPNKGILTLIAHVACAD